MTLQATSSRGGLIWLSLSVVVIAIDQLTKYIVLGALEPGVLTYCAYRAF